LKGKHYSVPRGESVGGGGGASHQPSAPSLLSLTSDDRKNKELNLMIED